ncbi:MAG: metal-dependent transcriptional regulator [Bacilli bacterium]|jgi:Mn-dependent DtxR family transcriptional regulator|nr:metal-dependent transcriptional regulator [Bacilli bacterium]MDD2681655.1 metal-dependent transcriptional regulator [Bacilli bacterium]MDD3120950.1 metal-dependent transcriptional regulator [Bacilli bacterium]MDD4063690.1 metal-dependent transcriptional regulator [Bacilli bacterium]MDD4481764.1 metal-dependent transcriptional regulator [Bacilli bacterium]
MKLYESAENYLERILMLKEKNEKVRSIDIALDMNFTKASISRAMKNLKQNEFIVIDKEGYIDLTNKGLLIAKNMLERHRLLTTFLIKLGVPSNIAADDACKIEHDLSEDSFKAIKNHFKNIKAK